MCRYQVTVFRPGESVHKYYMMWVTTFLKPAGGRVLVCLLYSTPNTSNACTHCRSFDPRYHADNEMASLKDLKCASLIISNVSVLFFLIYI